MRNDNSEIRVSSILKFSSMADKDLSRCHFVFFLIEKL